MPAVEVGRRTSGATKVDAAAAAAIGDADNAALIAPLHLPQTILILFFLERKTKRPKKELTYR